MTLKVKVFCIAHMPPELEQAWLQHVRDFDTAHPNCFIEMGIDAPDIDIIEAVQRLQVEPELTFTKIFERAKRDGRG
jgi:hypothetical protein